MEIIVSKEVEKELMAFELETLQKYYMYLMLAGLVITVLNWVIV